jgi:uncharacterized membrane protein YdjX (TVP38/TMEM64 family)
VHHRYPTARFAALVATVVGLAVVVLTVGLPAPATLAGVAERAGWWAPVLAVAGSALLLSAMVPRSVLAAAGGVLFGPAAGAAYVLVGAAIGAAIAFGVGRLLGRDFVLARRRGAAVDQWVARRGIMGVLTLRLLPVAPFGPVSYAFGATGVSFWAYFVGTVISMVPSTVIYASLGASALNPGSPGFAISLAAALAMALASTSAAAFLARRHRRRQPGSPRPWGSDPPPVTHAAAPADARSAQP